MLLFSSNKALENELEMKDKVDECITELKVGSTVYKSYLYNLVVSIPK